MSFRSVFRLSLVTLFTIFGFSAQSALAANLVVDDDQAQCPAASYTTIQSAIDAAAKGDTVVVCEGTYSEGPGTVGSNALTITKSIDIRGAGADKVTIQPTRATPTGGQIAASSPVLRDGIGNIVSINGKRELPIKVNISGVTISGGGDKVYFDPNIPNPIWNGEFQNGVYAETGVLFLDAGGSFNNSRVTNVVTSETPGADVLPGGYRSNNLGWGLAQVTAATVAPIAASLPLQIKGSRFDRYNRGGVLIDGATNDSGTLIPSGNPQEASIVRSTVVGRLLNSPPLDGSGGGNLLTTGTVFGQDGVRVTSGSSLALSASDVFQNLPAGTGADTVGQLNTAAGLRFIGAAASSANGSNIEQNGYGVINVQADGTTANTATPVTAYDNWWGVPRADGTVTNPVPNTGPGVSPATLPTRPNNPVNGSVDANFGSDAVHFKDAANNITFREGNEADSNGHWPTAETPAPISDNAPSVTLRSDKAKVLPGGQITLTADAVDDFSVNSLSFYQGNTLLGTVTPPNNTVQWTAPSACASPQTVGFTVIAEDSEGQTAFDDLNVNVEDCAPEVSLTAEANASGPLGAIKLSADVHDDTGLSSIKFYEGGRLITMVGNPKNNAVTSRVFTPEDPCGSVYSFEVVVTDKSGHQSSDTTTYDQTHCAPIVNLSASDTQVGPGDPVTLTADATDETKVAKLTFFAGSTQLASFDNPGNTASWSKSYEWTAPKQCGTSTVLKVVAENDSGMTTENTVTVTVSGCPDNPPTVALEATPDPVDAGGTVTLTARANDDHRVTGLAFFAGSEQIGTLTPPDRTVTWTAPTTCGTDVALKVVATDSADQTGEDTVTVSTKCVAANPTVKIDSPPAKIAQNGTTVKATATADAGVTKVTFYLGTRQVCVDTAAPYSCNVLPRGDEVGATTLRAVVTDGQGRTADDTKTVTVNKFKPKNLSLKAKRIGKKKTRLMVSGKLVLPARMTAADGCTASRVDVSAKVGKTSLANKQVALKGCKYKLSFAAPKSKKKTVIRVKFPGNDSLTAIARVRKVR